MSRSGLDLSGCVIACLVLTIPAAGQGTVEAGLGAASSSIGTAGARGANKSISGVFRTLDETLKSTGSAGTPKLDSPAASGATKPVARRRSVRRTTPEHGRSTPTVAPPIPSYEDAMQIQKGIGYEELLRRFGPPAMIASGNDAQTMSYLSNGGVVQVELQAGTVISVAKTKSGA